MKIGLEFQTNKFEIEDVMSLLEDNLLGSSVVAPKGVYFDIDDQNTDCSIIKFGININKLENKEKVVSTIQIIIDKLLSDTSDIEKKEVALLVQLEIIIEYFDVQLTVSNIHDILVGTKEYVENSIILTPGMTLAVFVDELSSSAKDKIVKCVKYIINNYLS